MALSFIVCLEKKLINLIMVRQFRYPLNDYIYELPAGLIDPGESIKETAIREMKEENRSYVYTR